MEEIMYKEVNRLYDEAKKNGEKWLVCDCIQCRVDSMCYALNRVKPRYIKSSKGLAYFFQVDFKMGSQFFVDISSVALLGGSGADFLYSLPDVDIYLTGCFG